MSNKTKESLFFQLIKVSNNDVIIIIIKQQAYE